MQRVALDRRLAASGACISGHLDAFDDPIWQDSGADPAAGIAALSIDILQLEPGLVLHPSALTLVRHYWL